MGRCGNHDDQCHDDVVGDHDDVVDNQCHDDSPVMALLDERTEETGQSLVGDPPPLTRYTLLHILTIVTLYTPLYIHTIQGIKMKKDQKCIEYQLMLGLIH